MQETGGNYIHECCQASNLQGRRTSEHFTSILGGSKQAGKEEKRDAERERDRGRRERKAGFKCFFFFLLQ